MTCEYESVAHCFDLPGFFWTQARRVLAEISASDVSLLMIFNYAIHGVLQNNQALARLDGYERSVVRSLEKSSVFGLEGCCESREPARNHCQNEWIQRTPAPPLIRNNTPPALRKCHNDCMARKQTRGSTGKSTEWNLGQPLAFPSKLNRSKMERLARAAVEGGMRGPLKRKRLKRKKNRVIFLA